MDSCDQQIQVGGSSTPTPGNPLQQSTMISPSSDTTCRGGAADMDRWRDVPFQCLLALAQTPSAFNYGVPQQQHYGLGLPPPPPPPPPPTIAESSSTKTGLTFAPLTPHKNNKSSRDQSLECEPDLLCLETLQQADDFPLQPDGRPPDEHCSSSAVGLTWENHSREKVDFKVIDLNKTPPRRKPKRKKHIPKVRVDGKPNKGKSPSHKTQKQPKRKNDKRKDSNPHARAHAGNPNTHESATSNANHTGTSKDEKQGAATEEASTTPVLDAAIAFKEDTPRNILKYSRRGVHKTASTMEPAPELPAASRAVFSGNSRHDATEGSTTPPAEATGESADPRCPQPTKRPCRRMLDFNLDGPKPQSREATGLPPKPTTHNGIEVKVQNTLTGHPYDFNTSVNEMVKRYSSKPGNIAPGTPLRENGNCSQWNVNSSESNDADIEKAGTRSTLLMPPISIASSGISSTTLADVGEASESAHKHSCPIESATGFSSGSSSYQSLPWALMPVCRKKRTGKGQSSTIFGMPVSLAAEKAIISCTPTANINYLTYAHSQEKALPGRVPEAGSSLQNKLHNFSPLNEIEMSTKRRSRAHVRVRDLASLANIPLLTGQTPPTSDNRHVRDSNRPDMNMEALLAGGKATSKRKKISKGNLKAKYASSRVNDKRRREIMVPLDQNQFPAQSSGSLEMLFNQMLYVDALAEQLKHLSINRESPIFANTQMNQLIPYRAGKQKQNAMMKNNAMVVYTGNDRMVIPFPPVKKKRPRAKVDLDEETERVFNLLLKDINSEGIDGTTEAKKKYWENERRIFRGRTDSFIARMHLVQGDRRFTKWKGSVVDSVVGVFLTQNVSDHLSSSAFMSMAAHFPVKKHQKAYWEEGMPCVVTNPIISMPDEETTILDEMSNQSVFYRSSITLHEPLHEEVEVVHTIDTTRSTSSNTNEFVVGQQNYNESVISSQNSTVSSQNSNSPVSQTVDRKESSSETDSQELDTSGGALVNTLNGGSSFVELLQMAQSGSSMPHEVPSLLHQRLNETEKIPLVDIQTRKEFVEDLRIIGEPLKQLAGNELQQKEQLVNCQVEISDIAESSSKFKKETTSEKRTTSKLINQPYKGAKDIDAARRKAKSRRVGDEIKDADWEALRRGAIKSAGKKERAENAMDSVDWEAVRCADVGEIAETIKARGMNNMLAARIKEFLNKLVTYHGSVDLEWLRDVAPDRAKEYLLSFNGLGLKSVECVRLLTLHHLAFPVDTNVGRIAVRLGWVPLEPLPESLQLHLLEMYPILDTIQKYLWPRLCKLDQKTLYELHYQLITFGKVFCTKSKPNCNACPMRGECRHFASAFASARLSLPGPEEKRIVNVTQDRPTFPRPVMQDAQRFLPPPTICEQPNQPMLTLSLPPSRSCAPEQENHQQSALRTSMPEQENHRSATDSTKVDCVPIIEEPLSPEPECTQVSIPDMEDAFFEDPDEIPAIDEIPTIDLNVNVLAQNIKTYIEQTLDLRESDISLDLVAMATEATSIPPPKLKNISRLRTEHQVYELPDCHPLLQELDKREYDDPSPYLLAIWTPGETADSIEPPKRMCTSQSEGRLCEEGTCASCNNYLEARRQIVRGTILIPCRTAMRGSFPLNGTYFQVNEVFADQESSFRPIEVPRSWLWNLPRRTVYFGTSVPTIFRGLTTEEIQQCFWRGFVCVRGFDRVTRDPRPLMARLHYPASKLRPKGKNEADS